MKEFKGVLIRYATHLVAVSVILFAGYYGYSAYIARKNLEVKYQDLIGTKDKFEKLTAYTAKLESDYRSQKDLQQKASEQWKEVVRAKDEKILMLSDATYLIGKHFNRQNGPDYYFETPKKTQNLVMNEVRLDGPDSPPIGFVIIKSDGTTYKGNYKFEVDVQNLQVRDEETGQVKVYAKAFFKTVETSFLEKRKPETKQWKNVAYPLPIKDGVAFIDPTVTNQARRFYLWAPRLVGGFNAGAQAGSGMFKPMLGFSLMGHGYTTRDLDWRILQFGVDVGTDLKNPGINFVPFTYRPLTNILTNTYLGPGIGLDGAGLSYFLNVSLGF